MRRWGVLPFPVAVLAGVLATTAAVPPPAPPVCGYVLAESRKSVSPAGERASAVRGRVSVLGGTARWDLESGTFPGATANTLVLGERGGWLVDRKTSVAARAGLDDVTALFVSPARGEPGPFQASVRNVEVSPAEVAAGPAFEGRPTTRRSLTATWVLVLAMPGRVGSVRNRLTAVVDLLPEPPPGVRSPLDDLGRLFDVPVLVKEALAAELASLAGWPVSVVVETDSVQAVDYPGAAAPPSDERRPLQTFTQSRREVSSLASRPSRADDPAAFALSEETRVVGLERLVSPRETLR
jgi:hypothetical protein